VTETRGRGNPGTDGTYPNYFLPIPDMRQQTANLDLESPSRVPRFDRMRKKARSICDAGLGRVRVYILELTERARRSPIGEAYSNSGPITFTRAEPALKVTRSFASNVGRW
jgi:hypothetical protein